MSDKLLIEIDMNNGDLDDAVPALVFLANELVESGTFDFSSPIRWKEKNGYAYQLRWRFAEDGELNEQVPLDVELLFQLNEALERVRASIPESENIAIENLRERLGTFLPQNRTSLLSEAFS